MERFRRPLTWLVAFGVLWGLLLGSACSLLRGASGGRGGDGDGATREGTGPGSGGAAGGAVDEAAEDQSLRAALVERLGGAPGTVFCAAGWAKDVVAPIDAKSDTKKANLAVARSLMHISLKPDGSELWGAPQYWDTKKGLSDEPITIIDPATGKTLGTIPAKRAGKVAFTPDGQKAYVTLTGADQVAIYDTASRRLLGRVTVGKHPFAISISFDGKRAYVGHGPAITGVNDRFTGFGMNVLLPKMESGSDYVAVIDLASDKVVGRVPLGGWSSGVAVSPDGRIVYATVSSVDVSGMLAGGGDEPKGGAWDGVAVVDASKMKLAKKLPFSRSSGPKAVAFTPDGKKAYTICGATDIATPIDVTTHRLGKAIALGLGG